MIPGLPHSSAKAFVEALYSIILKRAPAESEVHKWADAANRLSAAEMMQRFADSIEYKEKNRVTPFFPNGHYHSPVVDPDSLGDYVKIRSNPGASGFDGINIDIDEMKAFWDTSKALISSAPFPEIKDDKYRFSFYGAPFPYGDALALHAIMGYCKPKRIVEIGSGFSTACMLDSADIHHLSDLHITCIEPYPDRLNSLLLPADKAKITLLQKPVQHVPVADIVGRLEANDILFIDSTHVLKTGSDVHYEIFEVLPAVRPGVMIHIHDCPYPFEYGQPWIDKNYSWNEVYAVRAFLMYNMKFKIVFWGGLLKALFTEEVIKEGGRFSINAGTSLWLSRVGW